MATANIQQQIQGRFRLEQNGLESNKKIAIPVDLIRTIAIGLVVLLHASNEALQASSVPMPYWWTALVYKSLALSCVPLFVMLSGALLLQPAKLDEPIRVFLKKRLSRIGLAFGFWSMVYLAWGFYVTNVPVTLSNVVQGIVKDLFTGAWYHFWFIYLIVGLYLITPILRVIISNGNPRITRYLICNLVHRRSHHTSNSIGSGLHFKCRRLRHRRFHRLLRNG